MRETRRSIFLSHNSKDLESIKKVAEHLEVNGIPCWYAPRNIPYGQDYNVRIATDIENVEAVLVFITENVGSSEFVPREIGLAMNYKRTIIPILVDGSPLPKSLELFLCITQGIDRQVFISEEDFLDNLAVVLEEIYQGNVIEHRSQTPIRQPIVLKDSAHSLLFETPTPTLIKTEEVFVPPTEMKTMRDKLEDQHILYIHNPYHVGKYTTALSLFQNIGIHEIYEWTKEASFIKIAGHPLKKGGGFLAEMVASEEFFNGLFEHNIEAYIQKLKERDSYLILIGREEPLSIIKPYAVSIQPPHDPEELLVKHTLWIEKDQQLRQKIIRWIKSSEGRETVPNQLFPRDVESYIHKVKKLMIGEITKKELIESLDRNVKERVKNWFKEKHDLKDIAFYLTLSMYEGNTYPIIVEKSRQLLTLLLEYLGKELVYEEELLGRDEYLSHFHAHVKKIHRNTDVGVEETDAVFFIFSEDVNVIWEYLWTQYPSYHVPLINWLQQLLSSNTQMLSENMKGTLLHLLKKDSISVRNNIILPWANSFNPRERMFTTLVLQELAKDEDQIHIVFNLTNSWANQKNNERLRWTAIVLLGTELSASYFPQSLRLLRKIYEKSEGKLVFSIQRSFENISKMVPYGTEYEKLYFRFWIEWFSETKGKESHEAMRIAQSVFAKNPKVFFKTSEEWNATFWIKLIRISLKNLVTRKGLEGMLESWVTYASRDSIYRDRLAKLLYSVYALESQQEKDYLVRFVNRGIRRRETLYSPIYNRLMKM